MSKDGSANAVAFFLKNHKKSQKIIGGGLRLFILNTYYLQCVCFSVKGRRNAR